MDFQEFATIIHDVYMVFIRNLIRLTYILTITKSMYSSGIKYSLARCFIVASLLALSFIAKSQEDKEVIFISYENFLPTPKIGVYKFYEKLLKAFPHANGRIIIEFSVMKDSSVLDLNSLGYINGIDSLKQKFENISKWIPANKDNRPMNIRKNYSFQFGKLNHIGDIGYFFNKRDSIAVYDKDHIRHIGGRWLDRFYISTVDYFFNKGKIKKIVIKNNNLKEVRSVYDNYSYYKSLEQFLVFYYGLPTEFIQSPTIDSLHDQSFFEMIKEIENKDYSVSWKDFLDGKILLEKIKGKTQLTYEFY
ncbi:hypothetical protein [Sphingobacterium kitahiroshimense]|uniref:hypothetical protein n=1 Tax=Sphingobacterium kitahiroshimense TaxID=470446 RepID=UPI003208A1D9